MRRVRGVSLVETVGAVTLFLLAMVVGLNLLPSTWLSVKTGEERLFANSLAQSHLDVLRTADFASYTAGEILPRVSQTGTDYQSFLDVQCYRDPPPSRSTCAPADARVKVLTVTVRWRTRRGPQAAVRRISVCKLPR